ncbi:MAG TPA: VTT domain-containing protein [Candidatus Saccharimonadales bacterium]|jgi:membrane-associated protein|nr:VTT domain-containing protein [Candidatus Saccharimonadales bacterium]
MIPGIDVAHFIQIFGVFGVAAIIFAESGLLIGFFLPGDTLLFTAGFLAHQNLIGVNVHTLAGILFVAAALGDSVGYAFGRRIGRKLFQRQDSLLFSKENVQRAELFYEKHGSKTIVLARFIPVVRTFAPIVAGVAKMNYKTFLIFNLSGSLLWAAGITYLGYFVGGWFKSKGIDVDHYLLPVVLTVTILSFVPPLFHVFKNPKNRARLQARIASLVKRSK